MLGKTFNRPSNDFEKRVKLKGKSDFQFSTSKMNGKSTGTAFARDPCWYKTENGKRVLLRPISLFQPIPFEFHYQNYSSDEGGLQNTKRLCLSSEEEDSPFNRLK